MDTEKILRGKWILIVDDEQDVLDMLTELLEMCRIDQASSFEEGKELLETNPYDVAVLDIMGVKGYELLDIAGKRNIPALMLTAHALTKEDLKMSADKGASFYAPKDEINRIDVFVADVIEAREKNRNVWAKWYDRLGAFYDRRFGPNWRDKDPDFWDHLIKY
ncbi:MAG: response regulator [Thermodesulfobacteriota bacterium]